MEIRQRSRGTWDVKTNVKEISYLCVGRRRLLSIVSFSGYDHIFVSKGIHIDTRYFDSWWLNIWHHRKHTNKNGYIRTEEFLSVRMDNKMLSSMDIRTIRHRESNVWIHRGSRSVFGVYNLVFSTTLTPNVDLVRNGLDYGKFTLFSP